MSSKLRPTQNAGHYTFECPGCGEVHVLVTPRWTFDGNMEAPTVTPSLRCTYKWPDEAQVCCHFIITKGMIFFCTDCTHPNVGKTLPMKDISDGDEETTAEEKDAQ